jgi:hypothetical protein
MAIAVLLLAMLAPLPVAAVPIISPGTPTTTVPVYLTDGSYLFGITVTLGVGQFLLPVEITGATNLQNWQFDLLFDNTVVEEVDPGDGSSGIYGAEFTPGDPNSTSFILGGFPFNFLGLVDDVAGSYPSLLTGPSGDGVLAFILFGFLPDQENNDPGFSVEDVTVQQIPEPATLALLAGGLAALLGVRRQAKREERRGL